MPQASCHSIYDMPGTIARFTGNHALSTGGSADMENPGQFFR
jgi:hypothetical protein